MPDNSQYTPEKKKKREATMHERRMYNQYAKKAISRGEDVLDMDVWIANQEKKRKKE